MGSWVLIISRDKETGQAILEALATAGIKGVVLSNVTMAAEALSERTYSLAILDATNINAYILYQVGHLQNVRPIPLLVLYDPSRPEDKMLLLRVGAIANAGLQQDLSECVLQARNLIRAYESKDQHHPRLVFGTELEMDWRNHTVILEGMPIKLSRKEFDLLFYLAEHERQIFSWQELYREIWKREPNEWNEDTVRDHFKMLRKKLKPFGRDYVRTRWGVGYYFIWDKIWGE